MIMKKKFKIEVDCPNCAAKIERAILKIDGVNEATVSFMTQKMILDAEDSKFDAIFDEAVKTAKKIESGFKVLE